MDFEPSDRSVDLAERLRAIIDERVTQAQHAYDTELARWYASLRALRIADGPDEMHSMAIARRELRRHNQAT